MEMKRAKCVANHAVWIWPRNVVRVQLDDSQHRRIVLSTNRPTLLLRLYLADWQLFLCQLVSAA